MAAKKPFTFSRHSIVFTLLALAGVALLWSEHKAHILGALPYLILLLCPLMHLFLHGGHGHEKHHGEHENHHKEGP